MTRRGFVLRLFTFTSVLLVGFALGCGNNNSGSTSNNGTGGNSGNGGGSASSQFLYALTSNLQGGNSALSGFAVSSSGTLTSVGAPLTFPTPTNLGAPQVAQSASGNFLFETTGGSIVTYQIGQGGALTQVSSVAAPDEGFQILPEPSGHFLYANSFAGNAASIVTYSIDQSTGALTQINKQPQPLGFLLMDPKGRFLYVVNIGTIQAFAIDTSSGTLTPKASTSGLNDDITALSPDGKFLYTGPAFPHGNGFSWTGYVIDPNTGALTSNGQETVFSDGGYAFDPTSPFLFVNEAGKIRVLSIDTTTGTLTEISGSPFNSGVAGSSTNGIDELTVDRSGRFLFVTDGQKVASLAIDASGALTPVAGSPFAMPSVPPTAISLIAVQPTNQ